MKAKQPPPAKKKAPPPKPAAKPKAPARAKKPAPKAASAPTPAPEEPAAFDPSLPLPVRDELFAQAYLANGLNATQAYTAVHPKAKASTARTEGCKTLAKPNVASRVKFLTDARAKKFEVDGEELLRQANAVANADHRHLTQYVYRCCRYCYGAEHKYQRTLAEFEKAKKAHEKAEWEREAKCLLGNKPFTAKEFDEEGGAGFNEWLDPKDSCPNCFGKGKGRMEIADTRNLPPDAVVLFAGVEETKDGLKVKMHDKGKFSDMLFRHKGLFEADNAQQAAATSPEALERLAAAQRAGRERQLATLEERRGVGFTGD